MSAKYLVLEKDSWKIVDQTKSFCKRLVAHCSDGRRRVFCISAIKGTQILTLINEANNTNY
jgi:hypothetical protein